MGKSIAVAERRRQRTMMWPFLPFLCFAAPKKNNCQKKNKCQQNKEVEAATETCVHDDAGSSGTGTEALGVTEMHEATNANEAAAAATDLPIDPFVDKCAKALAFGYEDAWPYSSFNRPGLIIMLLKNNKQRNLNSFLLRQSQLIL